MSIYATQIQYLACRRERASTPWRSGGLENGPSNTSVSASNLAKLLLERPLLVRCDGARARFIAEAALHKHAQGESVHRHIASSARRHQCRSPGEPRGGRRTNTGPRAVPGAAQVLQPGTGRPNDDSLISGAAENWRGCPEKRRRRAASRTAAVAARCPLAQRSRTSGGSLRVMGAGEDRTAKNRARGAGSESR